MPDCPETIFDDDRPAAVDFAALRRLDPGEALSLMPRMPAAARGRLAGRDGNRPMLLTFRHGGRRLTVRLQSGDTPRLELACRLGFLPYTIEDATRRSDLLAELRRVKSEGAGRVRLSLRRELVWRDAVTLPDEAPGMVELVRAVTVLTLHLEAIAPRFEVLLG